MHKTSPLMQRIALATLFVAIPMLASSKEKYQEAIFVGSVYESDGSFDCSGDGTVRRNGDIDVSERCKSHYEHHYRIALGGYLYTIKHTLDHPKTALFTMGYSAVAEGSGVLSPVTPSGTSVSVRFDKNSETIHVKVGKRESRYKILPGTVKQ